MVGVGGAGLRGGAGRVAHLVVAVVAVGAAACGGTGPFADAPGVSGATRYDCYGVSTTAAELEAAPGVGDLDDHPGAESFAAVVSDVDEWMAVVVEDDELGAIRALEPPEVLDGEVRDHERLVLEHVGEAGGVEADARGWMVTSSGPCALRAQLSGLGPATVLLDPGDPPAAEDRSVSLWVVEAACASGQPATDRVRVQTEEAVDEVRFVVGVEPAGGDQACPSNPPTPVTVELDEPVGERRLVDAARLPAIELEEAPADLRPQE